MTTKPYSITLFNCGFLKGADREAAEAAFCAALEEALGGADQVAPACRAYERAMLAHGSIPLPGEATDEERAAVARWLEAEGAGCAAAFAGWHRWPDGARFEITLSPEARG